MHSSTLGYTMSCSPPFSVKLHHTVWHREVVQRFCWKILMAWEYSTPKTDLTSCTCRQSNSVVSIALQLLQWSNSQFYFKTTKSYCESRTYVKKANMEYYWNYTILLLWRHLQLVKFGPKCKFWFDV